MIDCTFELNNKPMSIFRCGATPFPAFSGLGKHVNQWGSVCLASEGPIPLGNYYIFDRQVGGLLGPFDRLFGDRRDWFALYAIDSKIDDETYCDRVEARRVSASSEGRPRHQPWLYHHRQPSRLPVPARNPHEQHT